MNENIQGKVVVITGASSGLGEAAGRYLSAAGAAVVQYQDKREEAVGSNERKAP
jgi:NADP-dependent 3-hydroxy acid dehydrogenase YdfG